MCTDGTDEVKTHLDPANCFRCLRSHEHAFQVMSAKGHGSSEFLNESIGGVQALGRAHASEIIGLLRYPLKYH